MNNDKEIEKLVENQSQLVFKTLDVLKGKTFKCSIYLLKYISDKDAKYFDKFFALFKKCTFQEKVQVMSNVRANLIEYGIIKENENNHLITSLGIPYDIFDLLEFDEQQKIIEQNRKQKKRNSDTVRVMIGSGEDAIFVRKKRGSKYFLSDGTMVRAGDTPEMSKRRLDDRFDKIIYSKPMALMKKISRRLKNR